MRLFTPTFDDTISEIDKARYLIAWRLLFIFMCCFAFLTFAFRHSSAVAFGIYLFVFLLTIVSILYVHFTKNWVAPYYIFSFSASFLLTYSIQYLDNTLHYPDFFWMIATILFAFIGLGKRWAVFFIVYHSAMISYFFLFTFNRNLSAAPLLSTGELFGLMIEMIIGLLIISYLLYMYLQFKDLYENQLKLQNEHLENTNKLIEIKNRENLTLVKEVHHRVKNNLQIVISLLRMQANDIDNPEAKKHFSEAVSRIMTISMIHQKLYEQKNLSEIDFQSYLESLIQEVNQLHDSQITPKITIDPSINEIGLKTIVPLGLIINELITNSIKHKPGDKNPIVELKFCYSDKTMINFEYIDNGIWKEKIEGERFNFGLELISILTEQMEGSLLREGTHFKFELKNLDH